MRFLHTSDWHLGRSLYGKQRYTEFSQFLNWLLDKIIEQSIDVLLISGDIFDTTTPGNRAQQLYYNFLFKVASSSCRHIIIISGNHDSPSFLSAPKEILKFMNVVVITSGDDFKEQVVLLKDEKGHAEGVVCAVPYLRDRDVRSVEAGESMDDKNSKLIEAIQNHYRVVCDYGLSLKTKDIPIVAMGHLFVAGGKTLDGDGVRELYIGSLANIGSQIFPDYLDYTALGHLHVPQRVGGSDQIRYSGSPLPMGFGEARQEKQVIIIDFAHGKRSIETVAVPVFQELMRICGDRNEILEKISVLVEEKSKAWLEVEFNGGGIPGNLQEDIYALVEDSSLEVRVIKNSTISNRVLSCEHIHQDLDELCVEDVFERCLDMHSIEDDERTLLNRLFCKIVAETYEEDESL